MQFVLPGENKVLNTHLIMDLNEDVTEEDGFGYLNKECVYTPQGMVETSHESNEKINYVSDHLGINEEDDR